MIRSRPDTPASVKLASNLFIIAIAFCFLYVAKPVLIPLSFAGLFALLLYPLSKFFERNGFPRIVAILLTMLIVLLSIVGLVVLLSTQIYRFISNLPSLSGKLDGFIDNIEWEVYKNFNIQIDARTSFLKNSMSRFMESGVVLLQGTISTFITLVNIFGLIPMYVFLFLLYRSAFRDFFLFVSPRERHRTIKRIMHQVQKVVQNYILGVLTVMSIIAVINSTALYIVGVDYALFFGFFSAILTIIPYIGVIIGAILPTLYTWLVTGSFLHALTVVLIFSCVQFMEGNFITPRITGNKVQVNALAAIIALVAGGFVWGPAGLILFMPFIAIVKVVFDNVESMKPYGTLLSREFYTTDADMSSLFRMKTSHLPLRRKKKK